MRTVLLLVCLLSSAEAQTVVTKVFSGITTAQTSAPLTNNGQSMHLLTVAFPSESADATGLKVRLEAAYSSSGPWIPISPDITTARLLGSSVYAIVPAYGSFPYLRVRSLNTTGGKAMHVYYSGTDSATTVTQENDRYTL